MPFVERLFNSWKQSDVFNSWKPPWFTPIFSNHPWFNYCKPWGLGIMGIERFPSAKKDLRREILHKDRGFAVRLTPSGSTRHVKVANLDTDCLAASIPNSSQGFILVEREHLEERFQISDTVASLRASNSCSVVTSYKVIYRDGAVCILLCVFTFCELWKRGHGRN